MGIQKRRRNCDSPSPNAGGANCDGTSSETRKCYSICPSKCKNKLPHKTCWKKAVNGKCKKSWVSKRCKSTCKKCCGNIYHNRQCERHQNKCGTSKVIRRNCRYTCKVGSQCQ